MIHVEQLTKEEREQILYNHVRLGSQPRRFKTQIKPYLPNVAANPLFSPEIARRLGNPLFTKRLVIAKDDLDDFVERPLELLCEIIHTLDAGSRAALALVFMRGGSLGSPVKMSPDEEQAVTLLGGSLSDVRTKLIPNIDNEVSHWQDNWDIDGDPETHFESLVEALTDYKNELAQDPKAVSKIDSALEEIEELVEELRSEQPQEPDSDDYRGGSHSGGGDDSRSVFDDVDQ